MARNLMQDAIKKNVRSVSFSGANPASYPSGLPMNPIMSAIIPYMGWVFDAQANYMIPAVQRFDPNKVMGFMAIASMSALSEPLRAIAMGKEPNMDPGVLLKQALLGSGFLGFAGDLFNKINVAGNIFPDIKLDRYERKDISVFGPLAGLAKVAARTSGMVINRDYNKKDIKDLINSFPIVRALPLRYAVDQLVENTDLAERRTTE